MQFFTYDDDPPWPTAADGDGYSLALLDPDSAPDHNLATSWSAGATLGGTPGSVDTIDYATWKAGFGNPADDADDDHDGWTVLEEYYLGGDPTQRDAMAPVHAFDPENSSLTASITRRANATGGLPDLQSSADLATWLPATGAILLSNERIAGSSPPVDRLTFTAPLTADTEFFRFAY